MFLGGMRVTHVSRCESTNGRNVTDDPCFARESHDETESARLRPKGNASLPLRPPPAALCPAETLPPFLFPIPMTAVLRTTWRVFEAVGDIRCTTDSHYKLVASDSLNNEKTLYIYLVASCFRFLEIWRLIDRVLGKPRNLILNLENLQ